MDTNTNAARSVPAAAGSLERLSDAELLAGTRRLVGRSNQLLAELLAHLAEVEARGVYRTRACSCLYIYCIYELRFSEDESFRRVTAARLVRRFPALFDAVASGELHLTGLLMLGPHLTDVNLAEVLARAKHRTKRELAQLVRVLDPLPAVPAVSSRSAPRRRRRRGPSRIRRRGKNKRERTAPSGGFCPAIVRAIGCKAPMMRAQTAEPVRAFPRRSRRRGRHIPAAVRRAVVERDGERCTYVAATGTRCPEAHRLQFHHLTPFARGGAHTPSNITLRCGTHNALAAEEDFGVELIDAKKARGHEPFNAPR